MLNWINIWRATKLLADQQYGFRHGRQTAHPLLCLLHKAEERLLVVRGIVTFLRDMNAGRDLNSLRRHTGADKAQKANDCASCCNLRYPIN